MFSYLLSSPQSDQTLKQTGASYATMVRDEIRTNVHPFISAAYRQDDIENAVDYIAKLPEHDTIVILGTGGSALGAAALAQMQGHFTPSQAVPAH
jgi:glucose-6-phosphate isomerase